MAAYIGPIIVMSALGFLTTVLWLKLLRKKCLRGYWFEQMIATFGMASGVFITGALLLRICDPDSKSPVLASYSIAYTMMIIFYFALLNLFIALPMDGQVLKAAVVGAGLCALCLAGALISSAVLFDRHRSEDA